MKRCLICTNPTDGGEAYHKKCLKKLFGTEKQPDLDVRFDQLNELAKISVHLRVTVPGVQAKLLLEKERKSKSADKLTIFGL